MGVKIKMPNINADEYANVLRAKLVADMQEVIHFALEEMKRLTADSMSGASKKQITGDMLAAMGSEVFMRGADVIVGRWGFTGRTELYYKLQTITGFHHYPDGAFIEPSFALRDSAVQAIELLIKKLDETL
jgi:hypothetical protein